MNSLLGNRFTKKQQMQWTAKGAHLLLQKRTKTLDHELATTFHRWYPDFEIDEADDVAAGPQKLFPLFFWREPECFPVGQQTFQWFRLTAAKSS